MAAAYDDDSTDDEIGMNLQLAERLNIHRGDYVAPCADHRRFENCKDYKQYCNLRTAQQFSGNSSTSVDSSKDCSYSTMHRSYVPPNKKRQNGDKILEQFANPKRTCLSDRFPSTSSWNNSNEESNVDRQYFYPPPELSAINRELYPDKTYEDHLNNLADAEDSDAELSPNKLNRWDERINGQSSRSMPNPLSSSTSGVCPESYESPAVVRHGVQLIESGSDDDSKPACQNGALKGGRQSPDVVVFNKPILGRKVKKVLDSDDTDEDKWQSKYRTCPVLFSSSDSEDGGQKRICVTTPIPENDLPNHHSFPKENISPHCDHYSTRHAPNILSRCHRQSPCSSASSSFPTVDVCYSQFLPPTALPVDFQGKNPPKSCRTRRSSRLNVPPSSTLSQNSFAPNINPSTSSIRGRSRMHGSLRGSRNPGSPHTKSVHGRRQSEAKVSRGRGHSHREKSSLSSAYPDLFDSEDSSEVEFFTANSYSDTETSNESVGLHFTISPDVRSNSVICEPSVSVASSEDEISVVFSNTPHTRSNDQRRGTRALGRRYGRGTGHRHLQNSQEVVSLSPDPVEQVRQMEEDERFARMLQAQFDAEVNTPRHPSVVPPSLVLEWTDSDDSIIDPVGGSESEESYNQSLLPFVPSPAVQRRGGFRMHSRFPSTTLMPSSVIFSNRRTESHNRRRRGFNDNRWQLTRLFGISANLLAPTDSSDDDYDALLEFTELNGDVPRGLQRSQINRLPTRQYHGSKVKVSADSEVAHKRTELNKECQVCLSDYVVGDILRILPCFHEFHTPCIDPWLKINHTCPVCRVVVNLDE